MDYTLTVGAVAADSLLRRLPEASVTASPGPGRGIVALHRPYGSSGSIHWIIADQASGTARLMWCPEPRPGLLPDLHLIGPLDGTVTEATSMGTMLILATSAGLRYLRWTGDGYADLGNEPLRIDLQFRLVREPMPVVTQHLTVALDDPEAAAAVSGAIAAAGPGKVPSLRFGGGERYAAVTGEITDAVIGTLMSVTAESVTARGRFWQPFMVRSGLRLFDGTTSAASPPVMMWPSAGVPLLEVNSLTIDAGALTMTAVTGMDRIARCRLEVRITGPAPERLALWADYIGSLEIAVTEPFYTFSQSEPVTGIAPLAEVAGLTSGTAQESVFTGHRCDSAGAPCGELYETAESLSGHSGWLITGISDNEFTEAVTARGVFRVIMSLSPGRLLDMAESGAWTPVIPEPGILSTLSTAPLLDDTLRSGDRWVAGAFAVWNGCLSVAPLRRIPAPPPPLSALVALSDGACMSCPLAIDLLWRGERVRAIRDEDVGPEGDLPPLRWLYICDPDAREIRLQTSGGVITLPLTPHQALNGSFWYGGRGATVSLPSPRPGVISSGSVPGDSGCGGLLLTSPVGNPLIFRPGASLELPGRVVALRGALRSMSAGQFGAWPLYAFTDCGVSALSPSADAAGSWASQQLITPRGAVSARAVTALESGVAYVSADGAVCLLEGASLTRLDTQLEEWLAGGVHPDRLPCIERVAASAGLQGALDESVTGLRGGASLISLAYDPVFRLLLMFRSGSSLYARVWSADTSSWGLMSQGGGVWARAVTAAEGSVQPLFTDVPGGVVRVLREASPGAPVMALTGVLPYGGDSRRRPGLMRLSGSVAEGRESVTLYGSNDLTAWLPVASAVGPRLPPSVTGTPRRYYLCAIVSRRARSVFFV